MPGSRRRKSNTGIIALIISIICSVCCAGIFLVVVISDGTILPTPTSVLLSASNLSTIVASTAQVAQTQTMLAAPPTFTPFILNTPTMLPPVTLAPSFTPVLTDSSIATPTIFIFVLPENQLTANPSEICQCTGGLDCQNFATHNQAQACYEYCKSLGYGDVHGLDGNDQDGLACESLP